MLYYRGALQQADLIPQHTVRFSPSEILSLFTDQRRSEVSMFASQRGQCHKEIK